MTNNLVTPGNFRRSASDRRPGVDGERQPVPDRMLEYLAGRRARAVSPTARTSVHCQTRPSRLRPLRHRCQRRLCLRDHQARPGARPRASRRRRITWWRSLRAAAVAARQGSISTARRRTPPIRRWRWCWLIAGHADGQAQSVPATGVTASISAWEGDNETVFLDICTRDAEARELSPLASFYLHYRGADRESAAPDNARAGGGGARRGLPASGDRGRRGRVVNGCARRSMAPGAMASPAISDLPYKEAIRRSARRDVARRRRLSARSIPS